MRIIVIAAVFLIVLMISFLLWARHALNDNEWMSRFSGALSTWLKRPVSVESISVNPMGKVLIRGLSVNLDSPEPKDPPSVLEIEQLNVRFYLLPLLRRRLNVASITVVHPFLHLTVDSGSSVTKPVREFAPADTLDTDAAPLPFSFGVFHLNLENITLALKIKNPSGIQEMTLSGIELGVNDFKWPRHYAKHPEAIRGRIRLSARNARFVMRTERGRHVFIPDIDVTGHWQSHRKWDLQGHLRLRPEYEKRDLAVTFRGEGVGFAEQCQIHEITAEVGDQTLIHLSGRLENPLKNGRFFLKFDKDEIDAGRLVRDIRAILPGDWTESLKDNHAEGRITLLHGEISGEKDAWRAKIVTSGSQIEAVLGQGQLHGWQGAYTAEIDWVGSGAEFNRMSSSVHVSASGLEYARNDSVRVSAGPVEVSATSVTDRGEFPGMGNLYFSLQDLFGGDATVNIQWDENAAPISLWERLRCQAVIQLDSVLLSAIPLESTIPDGIVTLNSEIQVNGLKNMVLTMEARAPALIFAFGDAYDKTGNIGVRLKTRWQADRMGHHILLDSGAVEINDFLSASLSGGYHIDSTYHLLLNEGVLYNQRIRPVLPAKMTEGLTGSRISGTETFHAGIRGRLNDPAGLPEISAGIQFRNASWSDTLRDMHIRDISGEICMDGTPVRLTGEVNVNVGELAVPAVRSRPLQNLYCRFQTGLFMPDSLNLTNGIISMPDLSLTTKFSCHLDDMGRVPRWRASAGLHFQDTAWTAVLDRMDIKGIIDADIAAKTEGESSSRIDLSGILSMSDTEIRQGDIMQIEGLRCRIPFHLSVSPTDGLVEPGKASESLVWQFYEQQRPFFVRQATITNNLSFKRIRVSEYEIRDGVFDVDISDGQLRIPWFSLNLLGGNIGGNINVRPGRDLIAETTYSFQAHASRINAAKLSDISGKLEESNELNAVVSFQGTGLDFRHAADVNGYFHITQVGPRFASTLLRGLDIQGNDRSIQLTRRLLDSGWKPTLFSFDVHHGYVYPSLMLNQPWFSPVRIPGKLEYGRLPIAYFFQM